MNPIIFSGSQLQVGGGDTKLVILIIHW